MLVRRVAALPLLALLVPALGACGSPTHTAANAEVAKPKELPSINATVYPKASPSAAPTSAGPDGAASPTAKPTVSAPPAEPNTVTASGVLFTPDKLTVKVGDKVTWKNNDGFHTVTGGTGGAADPASPMNGQLTTAGQTYEATFTKAGTYPYYCQPHESLGMKGTVTVT